MRLPGAPLQSGPSWQTGHGVDGLLGACCEPFGRRPSLLVSLLGLIEPSVGESPSGGSRDALAGPSIAPRSPSGRCLGLYGFR